MTLGKDPPAAYHLFETEESAQILDYDMGNLHSSVAKALYMTKRGKLILLTAIIFLTERVNSTIRVIKSKED